MKTITERDREIINALVCCVSVFSEEQLLQTWWPNSAAGRKNGQRRLKALVAGHLLRRQVVIAKSVTRVQLLAHITPKSTLPDFSEIARASRETWAIEQRPITIYSATRRCRNYLGGISQMRLFLHTISHSLGVSAIYLAARSLWPDLIGGWVGEHECKPTTFREAQPDAYLADAAEQKLLAFEFAADYPAERFKRLDSTLRSKQIPYVVFGAAT